jgi:tripeptidyl-peptidase I
MRSRSHLIALCAAGLASYCFAADLVTLEEVSALPPGWRYDHAASSDEPLSLYVALAQPRLADLEARLLDISDPNSPNYGNHLSAEDIAAYRQPSQASFDAVLDWLQSEGISGAHQFQAWVGFNTTVSGAEALLGAKLAYYAYDPEPAKLMTQSYGVPQSVFGDIDFIFPLAHFMAPVTGLNGIAPAGALRMRERDAARPKRSSCGSPTTTMATSTKSSTPPFVANSTTVTNTTATVTNATSTVMNTTMAMTTATTTTTTTTTTSSPSPTPTLPCQEGTDPTCIRQLYNINYTAPSDAPSPSRFGLAGFLGQWPSSGDASMFLSIYDPDILTANPNYTYTAITLNGGTNPDDPDQEGMEAALDIDYALSIGYPTDVIYYNTGGLGPMLDSNGTLLPPTSSGNEPYLEFLQYLLALPEDELPHVLSISYSDAENTVPQAYATRVCNLFAQLTARGTTVLAASGDGGSTGGGSCQSTDGTNRDMLVPIFPASCPWVTSVGATKVPYGTANQVGASFSGGGFSNYFARPCWQDTAVEPLLSGLKAANGTTTALNLYNSSGRAIPDLAILGTQYNVIWGGYFTSLQGTSASTPVFAAMLALINDHRLRNGKPSLGFLNPVLYSDRVRAVLTDVTSGKSYGCIFDDIGGVDGWSAGPGYDCVTGLGTVGAFDALLEVLG